MKKTVIVLLLVLFPLMGVVAKSKSPVGLDAGAFISYGVFDTSSAGEYSDVVGLWATLFSVRGGFSGTLRYRLTDSLSVGGEAGVAWMSMESGTSKYTFIDIPVNAVFRWGSKDTFLEPSIGYYFTSGSSLHGMSAGLKASFNKLYIGGAYIFGGDINYARFTLGYQWNNIF